MCISFPWFPFSCFFFLFPWFPFSYFFFLFPLSSFLFPLSSFLFPLSSSYIPLSLSLNKIINLYLKKTKERKGEKAPPLLSPFFNDSRGNQKGEVKGIVRMSVLCDVESGWW
eukprot:Phypoly_transcript_21412.p1 GENE.Phypoly_transcript_21412~~Phypoly_transcript_21412.p1  ORF type:complete len:112 (-),score=15.27 Phypoly_transcript_21412:107-442(-)